MAKTILITTVALFLVCSCATKTPLKKGDLTGFCGYEIVDGDSSMINFVSDTSFVRAGTMYIQTNGTYQIKNDTLLISYFWKSCPDRQALCYFKQKFIRTKNNKLKIVDWLTPKGEKERLPKNYKDIILFKCLN